MEKLEMIVQGVEETTALDVKNSLTEFIVKANEWREQIDSLVIESVNDTAKMKIAREARLFLKNNRLEAKRLTDMKRDIVKAKKLQFDLEDRAWLKGFQLVEEVCKSLEDKALEKEKYAEKIEEERKEKLRQERWSQLEQYIDVEPYGLSEMPDSTFNALLTGVRQQYEDRIEAEKKAEREKAEMERLLKLYNQRRHETSRLIDFIDGYDSIQWQFLSDKEYNHIVTTAVDKRSEYEAEQEKIRQENERLRKEAEEKEAQLKAQQQEAAKKEAERIKVQKEKEAELARIQAELDMEKKREEIRRQREEEERKAEEQRRKEALLAPDKDKLLAFISAIKPIELSLSNTKSKEVYALITEKLEGWRRWSSERINEEL